MCPYVRNTRYMVLFMTIYTDQKLEKTPLMVVSEQSERAEIFALLRQKHMFFFIPTRKPETWEKAIHDCEQAIFVCVCLKHAILLNILLVNHIVCRYNVSFCS